MAAGAPPPPRLLGAFALRNGSRLPGAGSASPSLADLARDFSPRYERHRDDLVSIDISGLGRLFGNARAIGEELRRQAAARGARVHVAIAGTRTAALILALARPGLTVIEPGQEAAVLAPIPVGILENVTVGDTRGRESTLEPEVRKQAGVGPRVQKENVVSTLKSWGLRTLGDLAALPPTDLAARLGRQGLVWQAIARGEDARPLVPTLPEERFESSIDLEWPIEGLEPVSFALTRLLEPLSTRLERRDRGAAVLHVRLRLVSHEIHARSLQLPSPIRDVRTLRTLALLDLESHPPGAAIDRITVVIDPTPGRVWQHTLFTRAQPAPEQLSTLLARLGALMGQDRIGAPVAVDSHVPGAFAMTTFLMARGAPPLRAEDLALERRLSRSGEGCRSWEHQPPASSLQPLASALRRCRQPVPARVAVDADRPVRVTADRRGFAGGTVLQCAGPWRTSGEWWSVDWNRDEWDVALSDGAVYRIFRDRETDGWFIDAVCD